MIEASDLASRAPGGGAPSNGAVLPPRPERVRALRAVMGTPDRAAEGLARGIRATTRRHFELHVVPLVRTHWPALPSLPFYDKLRIGTCDLYASAPYTALFCAPRRPLLVRIVTDLGDGLPLPPAALGLLGRGAMELLGRFAYGTRHRRIVLIAAFIVMVDHVLDHCMDDPPRERGPRLEAMMDGRLSPDGPEAALMRALAVAMAEGLDAGERRAFDAAMNRLKQWIDAEVKAMSGEPDPRGLGHRLAGVEGTIDGLLFPVADFATEAMRRWMVDVSMFVQVADDWLDAELDAESGRSTPVTTGDWTFADVEATWRRTLGGVEALVREAGLTSPRYVRFVRDAYVGMMVEVMDAMAERPDA